MYSELVAALKRGAITVAPEHADLCDPELLDASGLARATHVAQQQSFRSLEVEELLQTATTLAKVRAQVKTGNWAAAERAAVRPAHW